MPPILDLARDYSRFVITFFDLISMSAPHIYISALPLSPQTSMIHKKYKDYACPLARVVHGLPVFWEPVVATMYHEGLGDEIVWSPCSKFIAVVVSGAVEIHDAVTLNLLSTLESPPDSIIQWLSFSPDNHILTQLNGGDLITWDLQTGGSVGTILPNAMCAGQLYFPSPYSMDGKMLTVLSVDTPSKSTFITTHDLSTSHTHCYHVSEGHTISPTWTHGKFLRFATVKPGHITIWESEFNFAYIPKVVQSLPTPDEINDTEEFEVPLFLPMLSRLAITLKNTLLIWDFQDSRLLLKIFPFRNCGMSFSSNGHFFACLTGDPELQVWKECLTGYILHQKLVFASIGTYSPPLLSPNGESVIISINSTVYLWHTKDSILSSVSAPVVLQSTFNLGFSPNETSVAFTCHPGNMVTIINLQSGGPQLTIDTGAQVQGLGVVGNIITVIRDREIATWDLEAMRSEANTNDSIQITSFGSSPSCVKQFLNVSISPDLSCGHNCPGGWSRAISGNL